jgi:hypothetical protein
MNAQRFLCVVALAGLVIVAPPVTRADHASYQVGIEITSVSDFYEPLAAHGYWVEVQPYGWCWYPAYIRSDWRPYTHGHWLWTDGGWYWVSEEPWAWAVYHHGRWVWHSYHGWLWVPDVEWAPAWVSWHEGGGYIGWAPLSPACRFGPGGVIYAEHVVVPAHAYVFVEYRRFCRPIHPSVIIIHHTIIHQTVNITRIKRVDKTVVNKGPDPQRVERETSQRVPQASIEDLRFDRPSRARPQSPSLISAEPEPLRSRSGPPRAAAPQKEAPVTSSAESPAATERYYRYIEDLKGRPPAVIESGAAPQPSQPAWPPGRVTRPSPQSQPLIAQPQAGPPPGRHAMGEATRPGASAAQPIPPVGRSPAQPARQTAPPAATMPSGRQAVVETPRTVAPAVKSAPPLTRPAAPQAPVGTRPGVNTAPGRQSAAVALPAVPQVAGPSASSAPAVSSPVMSGGPSRQPAPQAARPASAPVMAPSATGRGAAARSAAPSSAPGTVLAPAAASTPPAAAANSGPGNRAGQAGAAPAHPVWGLGTGRQGR